MRSTLCREENVVCDMPNGSKIWVCAYCSRGCPLIVSTSAPRVMKLTSEYLKMCSVSFRVQHSSPAESPQPCPAQPVPRHPSGPHLQVTRNNVSATRVSSRSVSIDCERGKILRHRIVERQACAPHRAAITAVAVTRHFVREAMSKIVSSVIGSTTGSSARSPYACSKTVFPA